MRYETGHAYKYSTQLYLPCEVFRIFSLALLEEASSPRPSHTRLCSAENNVRSIQPSSEKRTGQHIKPKNGKHRRILL